jgi:alpha-galactosidase
VDQAKLNQPSFVSEHRTASGQPFWVLETKDSSYALGLDQHGYLQHMYWGAKLAYPDDYGEPTGLGTYGGHERKEGVSQEEYPLWGDLKFSEACLKLRFADGTRTALFSFQKAEAENSSLVLHFKDPSYALHLELHYKVYADTNLVERKAALHNQSNEPLTLEQVYSACWRLPHDKPYTLSYFSGKWGADFQLQRVNLTPGKHVLESRRGITGFDSNPFFMLHAPNADEDTGDVYAGALAYSGNWQFIAERSPHGQTSLLGGISAFDFSWLLKPGESFETPTFVALYARGFAAASQQLHEYQLEHILPKSFAKKPRPVLYNSWYATFFDVRIDNQLAAARIAKDLGVELFVMDDGWFGKRDDDKAGLGDWYVNKEKFPEGLGQLIGEVNALGMDFGLWVEPEMVNQDSDLYRAHPDWVYHFKTRPRSEGRNQLILNLARDEVRDYLLEMLSNLLTDYPIRFLKWDMNRSFSEPGWTALPGQEKEIWLRHVRAVYFIMDSLRERHPDLMIESCASGGGRVDLGILQRTDQVWMSDNTDPYDDLLMTHAFSHGYAPKTRMAWVTDEQHGSAKAALEYRFHVAMLGSMGIGADLPKWSEENREVARKLVARYKEVRGTIQHGRLYRLRSPLEHPVSALQFTDETRTLLFVFLSHPRYGRENLHLQLRGLEAQRMYELVGSGERLSGAALMHRGLRASLDGDYKSQLIELRPVAEEPRS